MRLSTATSLETRVRPLTVLITGASGFVGRALSAALAEAGHRVRGTVRSRSKVNSGSRNYIVIGDLATANWAELMEDVDVVVHLAALAHQTGNRNRLDESEYLRVNAEGTDRIARAAAGRVSRFIYVSSIGACRSASEEPVNGRTPATPADPYGKSKLAGEKAVELALGDSATTWCVLRPPLIYGPGNPGNMGRLFRLLRTGVPLPLGGIRNRRSLLYLGNAVSAILTLVAHPNVNGQVFVVADDEALSTPELIRAIGAAAGLPVRLFSVPLQALMVTGLLGDLAGWIVRRPIPIDSYSVRRLSQSLVIDDAEFRELTAWRPPYSLAQGLVLTCEAMEAHV